MARLGRPPGNTAIIVLEAVGADEAFRPAGIRASVSGGGVPTSFRLYNTEDDVDNEAEALLAFAERPPGEVEARTSQRQRVVTGRRIITPHRRPD
ncbi:hypothetical protein GCM10023205_53190 [Yinghuangia aomiensis]|uniref:Uncharacterized protein n=1 Tax=Yinghuangia aomiensis TaxID=676205 RepID=A0ABP9HUJ1_9ACTN